MARSAAVVASAMVAAGVSGTIFGFIGPRPVHRFKLNPRIASGPAVLAITDVAAISAYLALAAYALG